MADPSKPEDIPIGSVIDGYIVEAKLGAGGMGAIYKVREPGTEELKALKVIATNAKNNDPEDGDNAKLAEERFQREAQVLAKLTRLEHPNIIAIHRYARFGGTQYIVMPLFSGVDLRRWVKTNPSLDRVLGVARQLAAAVGYAHSQGVLHRDLKLSNALINADDKVKLIDFGLAREASIEAHQLTQAGTASGTWAYLAPEYVASEMDHDILTEMWATGVMLYHLVTHRLPFSVGPGGDPVKLWKVIAEGKFVAVRELRPDCSIEFATLVHDLLQKDRARRIQNAAALAQRLSTIQSAQAPGVAPAAPLAAPVPEPTRPARQPAPKAVVPEATSSEWAPKADVGVATASQGRAQLALVNQLFEEGAGQGAAMRPVSDEPSLDMPEVSNAVLPQESAVAPRPAAAPVVAPAAPPLERSAAGVSVVGASATPAPVEEDQPTPSESRSRIARPTFAASSAKTDDNSRSALKKLALPLAAAGVVAAVMFGGWQYAENAVATSKVGNGGYVDPDTVRQERSAKAELNELQRAKREAPAAIVPAPAPAPVMAPTPAAVVEAPPPQPVAQPTPRKREPATVAAAPPPTPSGPAAAWDAIYGGRDSFNNPTPGAATKATPTTAATTAATAGIRVPVRLDGAIASSPAGPVIAVVTQETKVGGVTLPVGTQVHGQTSGTSGPRILVTFNFAIVGGQNVPLRGIAMSPDNRAGIPGTRSLGGASDVAAGGAQGAVSGLMAAAANVAGDNPAGDALRGAANPTSGKAARLNNEEEIVTTKRGARFVVYVGG